MMRDMTKDQFARELDKRGWEPTYFGYIRCDNGVEIYRHNGGKRLRSQLAYLIAENRKANERP